MSQWAKAECRDVNAAGGRGQLICSFVYERVCGSVTHGLELHSKRRLSGIPGPLLGTPTNTLLLLARP